MENLQQIIYVSTSKMPLDDAQLIELLSRARDGNKKYQITGLLLYKGGSFMQVIEGDIQAVTQLFINIMNDPSHSGIIELINDSIEEREFPGWSMGFRNISAETVDGFSDFFNENTSDKLIPGKAKTLLLSFKNK